MKNYKLELANQIAKITDLDKGDIQKYIEIPPNADMGDYTFPCFRLAKELKKREIYAGFDVFVKEPMAQNHPLLDKEIANKLVLTPHNAWGYEESKEILIEGILKNIAEFINA